MIKTKKKNPQSPLIVTGYILFALLVIGVLLSTTIPFGRMLFNPNVLHHNVALFTIALTVGAILPAVVGYIIGDHVVKSKSRASHHFNGVLFGFLAYWVMETLSVIVTMPYDYFADSPGVRALMVNILPSIGVAIVTTALALSHVRNRQAKKDLIEYKPFSITLIVAILLMPVYSLVTQVWNSGMSLSAFTTLLIILLVGTVSYLTLRKRKLTTITKLTWSAVSVTVMFVAIFVSHLLVPAIAYYFNTMPTMEQQNIINNVAWVLAILTWVVYWVIQGKRLK